MTGSVRVSMGSTARRAGDLDEAASSVTHVVGLIDAIASQTNMLALNATIESARAGELGKGFAVVAGKVKELAGEAGSATRDIGQRIGHIREVSAAVTGAFESLDSDITSLDEQQSLRAAMATEQSSAVAEISARVGDAAEAMQGVNRDIGGVSTTMRQTQELAAVSQSTARQLTDLVTEMGRLFA